MSHSLAKYGAMRSERGSDTNKGDASSNHFSGTAMIHQPKSTWSVPFGKEIAIERVNFPMKNGDFPELCKKLPENKSEWIVRIFGKTQSISTDM